MGGERIREEKRVIKMFDGLVVAKLRFVQGWIHEVGAMSGTEVRSLS